MKTLVLPWYRNQSTDLLCNWIFSRREGLREIDYCMTCALKLSFPSKKFTLMIILSSHWTQVKSSIIFWVNFINFLYDGGTLVFNGLNKQLSNASFWWRRHWKIRIIFSASSTSCGISAPIKFNHKREQSS